MHTAIKIPAIILLLLFPCIGGIASPNLAIVSPDSGIASPNSGITSPNLHGNLLISNNPQHSPIPVCLNDTTNSDSIEPNRSISLRDLSKVNDSVNRSDSIDKHLLINISVAVGTIYISTQAALYFAWYADYPQSSFHFINDNNEWLFMDKMGHFTSSYYITNIGSELYAQTGMNRNKSALIGGLLSLTYLTTVEIFDGFSAGWGASPGDVVANAAGVGLFLSQQFLWQEQRIGLKWSYHPTDFAQYRPDLLGKNGLHSALKDYNGQTYWITGNVKSFLHDDSKIPDWLSIAVGYSATGMTGAVSNPLYFNGIPIPPYERYSQFYLSPDIDLTKLNIRNKYLKILLKAVSFIKIPMPAVEFSKKGLKFYPVYF